MEAKMTFDEFIQKYEGKTWGYPNQTSYHGECLSLSKWHIREVFGIMPPPSGCNGARCYWSLFPDPLGNVLKKVPYTPGLIPRKGWIAVWNGNVGGGAGHIGSVYDDNATATQFTSLDQNWGGRHAHRVSHNYQNIFGFLIPKNENTGGDMNELQTYLGVTSDADGKNRLKEHLGEKDGKCNWGSEPAEGQPNIGGHLGSARATIRQRDKEIVGLKTQVASATAEITKLKKQIADHVCPIVPPVEPDPKFVLNGVQKTFVKDGVTITENYAVNPQV